MDHTKLRETGEVTMLKEDGRAGKCPMDHTKLRETGEVTMLPGAEATGAKCPVDHARLEAAQEGKCPVDHAARGGGDAQGGKPQKAVCPFGFGSEASGGPTITVLHCPKCALLCPHLHL